MVKSTHIILSDEGRWVVFKKFSIVCELSRIKIQVATSQFRFRSSEVRVIILILISIFGQMDNWYFYHHSIHLWGCGQEFKICVEFTKDMTSNVATCLSTFYHSTFSLYYLHRDGGRHSTAATPSPCHGVWGLGLLWLGPLMAMILMKYVASQTS